MWLFDADECLSGWQPHLKDSFFYQVFSIVNRSTVKSRTQRCIPSPVTLYTLNILSGDHSVNCNFANAVFTSVFLKNVLKS